MSDHTNPREADLPEAGPHRDRLAALLAAVTAPGRAEEWRGEQAALVAFRSAHRDPVAEPRRASMLKTALTKLLTVKIGLICAASLGVGGVAYAASTDSLPGQSHLGGAGGRPPGSHAAPHDGSSTHPTVRPSHPPVSPGNLKALCHDYAGRDLDRRGKALDDPEFHDLIGPAGGRDRQRFDDFCARLDHDGPSAWPSTWPGRPSEHPSTHPGPTMVPWEHPSGAPRK